jgi:hypothetical protein
MRTLGMVAFFVEPTLRTWRFTRTVRFIYILYIEYKYLTRFVGNKSNLPMRSWLQFSFHRKKYFTRLQCELNQCFSRLRDPPDKSIVFLKNICINFFFPLLFFRSVCLSGSYLWWRLLHTECERQKYSDLLNAT